MLREARLSKPRLNWNCHGDRRGKQSSEEIVQAVTLLLGGPRYVRLSCHQWVLEKAAEPYSLTRDSAVF